MLRRMPIAVQVIVLVGMAILLITGAMAAIAIAGPPPRDPLHRIAHMVDAFTGRGPEAPRGRIEKVATLSKEIGDLKENPVVAAQLASRLGAAPETVRAFTEFPIVPRRGEIFGDFLIAVESGDGTWRILRGGDENLWRWQVITLGMVALVALAALLLAWLAARRIVRPIEELGRAAAESRVGAPWGFAAPDGPPEVAAAADALRELYQRNRDHAEARMAMLAAITHDIGTPLARIAFRMERLPEAVQEAAMRDIVTIRSLLADSRTLAVGASGERKLLDLTELCASIVVREAETGRPVEFQANGTFLLIGNALALERMVQNLLDNALRYGGNARLDVAGDNDEVRLEITDDGPGFPDMPFEQYLKPFARGEQSRNARTGGSGLGLAIVAQAVEQHGGTIELANRAEGGALVRVSFPLADGTRKKSV
ncbi:MAG: hypothetical protein B7Y88_01160 [Sphingomonadales bacterium 32-64-17]|nr:MAG: hypothetical protein B7Y88_01160 [Sphingomonadales bacterium 32-64-17]